MSHSAGSAATTAATVPKRSSSNGSLVSGGPFAFDNAVNLIDRVMISTGTSTGTYDVDYIDVTNN